MKAKKIFLGRRLASVIIDLSMIFGLTSLFWGLLLQFTFIEFKLLLITSFIVYYTLINQVLDSRTLGKVLTGIKTIRTNGSELRWTDIFMREVVAKGVVGVLLPISCFAYLTGKQSWLAAVSIVVILIVFSTLILFIFKRQWWEIISKTMTSVQVSRPTALKGTFATVTFLTIASIGVIIYPALKGSIKEFGTRFYPAYPTTGETKKYTAFIKSSSELPVDYIFDLFKKYDIVVISERLHPEYTQYQFLSDVIRDRRFSKNIGNIFTECGSVSFQDTLDTYLHTSFPSEDSLNRSTANLQRNSNGVWPLWDNTNLFDLFKTVNRVNGALPDSAKVNWYFTDVEMDWTHMSHAKFIKGYNNPVRDSIMAVHIIRKYNNIISKQQRKKALVIMNSRHGYGLISDRFAKSFRAEYNTGTTAYLMKQFPGKVANVMMNTFSIKYSILFTPVQHGKWETAFADAGNPAAGFNFNGSPFGNDKFDAAFASTPGITYKDVFTGYIFYKPLSQHIKKQGFPYEFANFEDTILKRAAYVDQSEVQTFKSLIAYQKQNAAPVDSGIIPYALISNSIVVIIMPFFILISFFLSVILFIRQTRRLKPS